MVPGGCPFTTLWASSPTLIATPPPVRHAGAGGGGCVAGAGSGGCVIAFASGGCAGRGDGPSGRAKRMIAATRTSTRPAAVKAQRRRRFLPDLRVTSASTCWWLASSHASDSTRVLPS